MTYALAACAACAFMFLGFFLSRFIHAHALRLYIRIKLRKRNKLYTNDFTEIDLKETTKQARDGFFNEHVEGGGFTIETPGKIKYSDGYFERILKRDFEDIKDEKWQKLIHPADVVPTITATAEQTGTIINRFKDIHGVYLWFAFGWKRDVNSGVSIVRVRDITAEKIRDDATRMIQEMRNEASGLLKIPKV